MTAISIICFIIGGIALIKIIIRAAALFTGILVFFMGCALLGALLFEPIVFALLFILALAALSEYKETALYNATLDAVEATVEYADHLDKKDYNVNCLICVCTDGHE